MACPPWWVDFWNGDMETCRRVICCVDHFGETNRLNVLLRDRAERQGMLISWEKLKEEREENKR